jgi:chromosome segregation ATPase
MKKIHYLTVFTIIVTLLGVNVALAQTESNSGGGLWSKIFGPKKENVEGQKIKFEEQKNKIEEQRTRIEEQRLKMASTTRKIEDRLENRENRIASSTIRIQEREEKRASSTEARRIRLEEKFKTGIANQIAKINNRLSDAIDRITKVDTRLVAHIAKLKSRNIDTSTSDALLLEAKAKLTTATEKVTALNTSLQAILTTNISTTTKNTIKAKTAEANTYVKSAHEAYVKVIENLKPGRNKTDKDNATSTATTTP